MKSARNQLRSANLTFERLIDSVRDVHERWRAQAGRAINVSLTLRNWLIGAYIAEYELRGTGRASYGENLLNELANRLAALKVSNCNRHELSVACASMNYSRSGITNDEAIKESTRSGINSILNAIIIPVKV